MSCERHALLLKIYVNDLTFQRRSCPGCKDTFEREETYGVAMLIKGMPVALTDHIDRSPDKQLLRGKVGTLHSLVLHEQENSQFERGARILW